MTEQERAQWNEMVNEISDLCNTSFVTDKMTADKVNDYYQGVLQKIYSIASYPHDEKK